jgi:3-deoxy-D-manno-octulosonate 8-phosphate phosphatase (KDO 8-P phosphatase)
MMISAEEISLRLKKIKLLALDVDGVLTDGRIIYDNFGDELKFYNATDGLGLVLLRNAGIITVVITSKKSKANSRRAGELRIREIHQNVKDKLKVFDGVLKKYKISPDETCVVGDDLADLPMMRRSGFAVAVQNAVSDVKIAAHYVTTKSGGRGAVREVCENILKAQGKWAKATSVYFS